jgi:hypothetical protein
VNRFAKYALFFLAAATLGFPLGYWHAQRTVGEGARMFSESIALSEYETLAYLQYKQADAQHGAQAEQDLLNFMQQVQAKQKIATPRAFAYDKAQTLMRLALLDENAGNFAGYQNHLQQAQEALSKADNRWYSEKRMREFIAKRDTQLY